MRWRGRRHLAGPQREQPGRLLQHDVQHQREPVRRRSRPSPTTARSATRLRPTPTAPRPSASRPTTTAGPRNGGDDTSATQTFTITVTPVNDVPSFTVGPDASTPEQSTRRPRRRSSVGRRTSPPALPTSRLRSSRSRSPATTTPACSRSSRQSPRTGTLTFKPTVHGTGVAHITVRLHDDGGTVDGGVDTSADQSFTIDVSGVNDPPIAGNDVATARLAGPTTINVLGNDSGGPGEPADPIKITVRGRGIARDRHGRGRRPEPDLRPDRLLDRHRRLLVHDQGHRRHGPRRHGDRIRHDRGADRLSRRRRPAAGLRDRFHDRLDPRRSG